MDLYGRAILILLLITNDYPNCTGIASKAMEIEWNFAVKCEPTHRNEIFSLLSGLAK